MHLNVQLSVNCVYNLSASNHNVIMHWSIVLNIFILGIFEHM